MAEKKGSPARARIFATVVYPESAPPAWDSILADSKIPAFVSPLHDLDVNPDGEIKKSHYHVIVMYEGVKSDDQVRDFFQSFGGVGLERVGSIRGYARYLCHLDNPEKHRYDTSLVRSFSGADYADTISLSSDRYTIIGDMMYFCDSEGVYSFAELLRYARDHKYDWFRVLSDSGAVVMMSFLKSKSWSEKRDPNA